MISIRTPWWAAAVLSLPLALAIGCGSTEDTTSTPTPTPSTPPPTTTPATTDTKKDTEPAKAAPAPAKEESPKVEAPKVEAPKVEAPKTEPAKGAPKGASAVKLSDEEVAAIKKLPAGDQVVALKQAVCPVSGKHLGAMDAPFKVTAEGKTFYLCCDGCKDEVDANPKAVVAKLAK
jgi:YHS domain-containing protein